MIERMKAAIRNTLPPVAMRWVRRNVTKSVRFGNLRRLTPVSFDSGYDRGRPIDRYYIEKFLSAHAEDVRGCVLEFGDDRYIQMFGNGRLTKADVLHVTSGNPKATIVADLTRADEIPSESFDCIIMTQTLQMIYDMRAALGHVHRILKTGGVLLLTTHGTSRICRVEGRDDWGEYWRLTRQSARRLLGEVFPDENLTVTTYGNVLSAIAFLHGMAAEELTVAELDHCNPEFEVLLGVRAKK
jgi:SAM-dependent methyltransferase